VSKLCGGVSQRISFMDAAKIQVVECSDARSSTESSKIYRESFDHSGHANQNHVGDIIITA